jgi:glycosyltransferase involved in cell wall biosynthesis
MFRSSHIELSVLTGSTSRSAGGLFEAVRGLSLALARTSRVQVVIHGPAGAAVSDDLAAWLPLKPQLQGTLGPKSFGYAPGLGAALTATASEVLHTHGIWTYASVAGTRWAEATRRPLVISPHGMLDPWALRYSSWKKRLALRLYELRHLRAAAVVHVLNAAERDACLALNLRVPVCVIPNGIAAVGAVAREPPSWYQGVPRGKKILLFLGRLHPKKNVTSLVQGWSQVCATARGSQWHLVFVGWGDGRYRVSLESLVQELGIGPSLSFVGPCFGADKVASYAAADAFVLPSLSEGQPVAVLEAWAQGLPVIMTPECNIPEGFAANAAIRIGRTASDIARGLTELVTRDPQDLVDMGAAGLALVDRHYRWERTAEQFLELYQWLLGGGMIPSTLCQGSDRHERHRRPLA